MSDGSPAFWNNVRRQVAAPAKTKKGRLFIVGVDGIKNQIIARLARGRSVRFSHTLTEAYFEQLACRLRGALDATAFRRAWQRLVDRHPVLRTAFEWEESEQPVQVVKEGYLTTPVVDLGRTYDVAPDGRYLVVKGAATGPGSHSSRSHRRAALG